MKNSRSKLAIKNILASFLFKGGSIAISLVVVPMTLGYLSPYEYGIWLTLSSILTWVYILDVGLGNGLRNKLTEALAINDISLAKTYVSTTFISMGVIILFIYIIFLIAQQFINWSDILNLTPNSIPNINYIVTIVFTFFCASFIFRLIGNIYMAFQQSAINDFLAFISSLISLCLLFICTKISTGSLAIVANIFSAIPAIIYMIACLITFKSHKEISPSFKFYNKKYLKSLMSLGIQFFIIQISCLIVFMTSNIIISQLFSPAEVTPYNIAYKYFSLITMGFTIIVTPFWSAITDAYTKKDFNWIKKSTKNLIFTWMIFVLFTIIMILISPWVYSLWIGNEVQIPFFLSIVNGIYVSISNWNNIFAYIINGIGKIRLQLISSIISGAIFIPLAIYLGKIYNVSGIMCAMCICLLISSVWSPIQFWKIVTYKAKGIWNK